MSDPLVSVIIPTYNTKPGWLHKAIQSVLAQSYDNIELIVVDDCSTMPFSGIDRDYNEENIIWVKSPENQGVSAARNRGAERAKGVYLAFLDADDWWDNNKLVWQIDRMNEAGTIWSYTSAFLCDSTEKQYEHLMAELEGMVFSSLLKSQLIIGSCSGVVVKKNIFMQLGMFDVNGDTVEDWDMWIRLSRNYPVSKVDLPLVYLRTHIGNRSSFLDQKLERLERFQKRYREDYRDHGLLQYSDAHYYYITARQHYIAGNWIVACKSLVKSVISCPTYFVDGKIHALFSKIMIHIRRGRVF